MPALTTQSPAESPAESPAQSPVAAPAGPTGHLSADDVAELGRMLDEIRGEVLATRGAADAAYIRRVIAARRHLEVASRLVLLRSGHPVAWVTGTAGLALAKVLDNMEIGHNVLHGQWDWMRDPRIHSTTWEWDFASPAAQWKRAHNDQHHTFTNILGHDNDLGWGILRVDQAQPWQRRHLAQPVLNLLNACFFEYGIATYDLGLGELRRNRGSMSPRMREELTAMLRTVGRKALKEYVVLPVLSGRHARRTLAANATANLLRNLWSHSVIMCGHFPEGVQTFELEKAPSDESRGEWYLRQMLGSANISGGRWVHLLSGNLSHQIEHHMFPDLPSNRYAQIAPEVRAVVEKFGLRYHAAPLHRQVASAWHKVCRLALPSSTQRPDAPATTGAQTAAPGRPRWRSAGRRRLRRG